MSKRIVAVCMSLLFISIAAYCESPDPNNWYWAIIAGSSFQNSDTWGGVGVASGATDGYDLPGNDWQIVLGSKAYLGTYHTNGSGGWTGQTGFYASDTRAPLPLQPGLSKTWVIYVWADPRVPADASYIAFRWDDYHALPSELSFTMTLKAKPVGVAGGPALGTVWDLSSQPHGSAFLPVFRTANGLEGYVFDFTATVIPEPSTLAALLAGLAGFGAVIRRRR